MKKSTRASAPRADAPSRRLTAERAELAFAAAELRADLDAVLKKHNAKLQIGWEGKWAKLQFVFPALSTTEALSVVQCSKGGKMRYLTEAEENTRNDHHP